MNNNYDKTRIWYLRVRALFSRQEEENRPLKLELEWSVSDFIFLNLGICPLPHRLIYPLAVYGQCEEGIVEVAKKELWNSWVGHGIRGSEILNWLSALAGFEPPTSRLRATELI